MPNVYEEQVSIMQTTKTIKTRLNHTNKKIEALSKIVQSQEQKIELLYNYINQHTELFNSNKQIDDLSDSLNKRTDILYNYINERTDILSDYINKTLTCMFGLYIIMVILQIPFILCKSE